MSRLVIWIGLVAGIVVYRTFTNTAISLDEHVAGAYFSGLCLLVHWAANLAGGQK